MKVFHIDYDRIGSLSHTDLAYLRHDAKLKPFYVHDPSINSLKAAIEHRKSNGTGRKDWVQVVTRQYQKLKLDLPYAADILAADNTFTITTAHQPLLFTGPLYHVYKIASVINLATQLNQQHPGQTILPVFVIGSEDHDWAELNHFYLFGKKYEWMKETGGPAGRFDIEGLADMIEQVADKLQKEKFGTQLISMLRNAHDRATTYAEFHQALLINLFHQHGLLVINLDDADLKKAFRPILKKELTEQFSFQHVKPTQDRLEALGFKPQAYCREINLFHVSPGVRERIELVGEKYVLAETGTSFSMEELLREVDKHPEAFSPNVILRPLYQEFTLPDIAYIGGGSEVAYWLERKSQFEAAGIAYPVIIRRNSVLLIDDNSAAQIEKADLTWEEVFNDYNVIVKKFLLDHSDTDLTFDEEMQWIKDAYDKLAQKASQLDPTLSTAILAEEHKQLKQFEQLSSRLIRAEKQAQETNLKRIQRLKEKLFPQGGLQERHDNMMSYFAEHGETFLSDLIQVCNPLDERFTVVRL